MCRQPHNISSGPKIRNFDSERIWPSGQLYQEFMTLVFEARGRRTPQLILMILNIAAAILHEKGIEDVFKVRLPDRARKLVKQHYGHSPQRRNCLIENSPITISRAAGKCLCLPPPPPGEI